MLAEAGVDFRMVIPNQRLGNLGSSQENSMNITSGRGAMMSKDGRVCATLSSSVIARGKSLETVPRYHDQET